MVILPIIVAAIAGFFIGFMWYGPVFGNHWIKLKEIPMEKVKAMQAKGMGPMVPHMIGALIIQIIAAAVLQYLLQGLGITTIGGAIKLALVIWLGFTATTLFSQVLWEERKKELYGFDIAYHLLLLIVMAMILVSM